MKSHCIVEDVVGKSLLMLEVLRISNYAIIDRLEVEFSPALTVITGETGAGKSIVLGAFRVLLGDRASSDSIRSGSARAGIEGIFRGLSNPVNRWIAERGFAVDDPDDAGSLILRRDIPADGASRNFINGRSANVSQLKELGALLVDMHGQNEHSRLYAPAAQLQVLDSFGDYPREIDDYRNAYQSWRLARERFRELSTDQSDARRKKDFLEFQVGEIQQAELVPGEDEKLDGERRRLMNAEKLQEICADARDMLYEGERHDNPVNTQLGMVARLLLDLAVLDPAQESLAKEAESARFAVEDLSEKVRDYGETLIGDPQRLDVVEERLELIRALRRKYGRSIAEILETGRKLAAELDEIVNHDEALANAEAGLNAAENVATETGNKLSAARQKTARIFEKRVESAMRDLELPKAVLKIEVEAAQRSAGVAVTDAHCQGDGDKPDNSSNQKHQGKEHPQFGATGLDVCEFMISLNAGELRRPMRKVASGGEASRVMLAIKSVLAKRDQVPTLVFDEIDTGISGEAAARVGDRLEGLSASHQVICITHLPQVAAHGAMHLVVEKRMQKDRTITSMTPVEGEARTLALARMLSGSNVDDTSKRFAEKLLASKK